MCIKHQAGDYPPWSHEIWSANFVFALVLVFQDCFKVRKLAYIEVCDFVKPCGSWQWLDNSSEHILYHVPIVVQTTWLNPMHEHLLIQLYALETLYIIYIILIQCTYIKNIHQLRLSLCMYHIVMYIVYRLVTVTGWLVTRWQQSFLWWLWLYGGSLPAVLQ